MHRHAVQDDERHVVARPRHRAPPDPGGQVVARRRDEAGLLDLHLDIDGIGVHGDEDARGARRVRGGTGGGEEHEHGGEHRGDADDQRARNARNGGGSTPRRYVDRGGTARRTDGDESRLRAGVVGVVGLVGLSACPRRARRTVAPHSRDRRRRAPRAGCGATPRPCASRRGRTRSPSTWSARRLGSMMSHMRGR